MSSSGESKFSRVKFRKFVFVLNDPVPPLNKEWKVGPAGPTGFPTGLGPVGDNPFYGRLGALLN